MRRVQADDASAFGALMERWEVPVKAVIARIVLNASEAEDLAQETFVRLWEFRGRYQPDRPVKPWILGIAVNLARNRLRWWKRRPSVSLEEWTELPAPMRDDAAGMVTKERLQAVRDAVARLPIALREALVLFEYENMSHAEIAGVVGATAKAVESRIARAREQLRSALRPWA
jgi:RNA polymerase sigma-70 factor (ECF subfamily)